ncbi:hypothetical protein HH1059_15520 [Halorhodospira halochloris]|uniref:Curlin associated repeat-containing protein n=1 Tax=Halorhodospira halochloris TaxID=1052 RepID=A0A110B778_HALHR|nr:hypothetical protein [Halorhodospira halochloris]MBK1651967.1 hypothetical protein [Halorhodospira halochloris]BAU58258.1 hypothetical protein HH1059_15520 [Halorhodospira halochloris]
MRMKKTYISTVTAALLFGAGSILANSDLQEATINQYGEDQTATVDQLNAHGSKATITQQVGANNAVATILQKDISGATATIEQWRGTVKLIQDGYDSSWDAVAEVRGQATIAHGEGNTIEVDSNSTWDVMQSGSGNFADIIASRGGSGEIRQDGQDNSAELNLDVGSSTGVEYADVTVEQIGSGNQTFLGAHWSFNDIVNIFQEGDDNISRLYINSANPADVKQVGNNNEANVGTAEELFSFKGNVLQLGNDNLVDLIGTGGSWRGADIYVEQHGNENVSHVSSDKGRVVVMQLADDRAADGNSSHVANITTINGAGIDLLKQVGKGSFADLFADGEMVTGSVQSNAGVETDHTTTIGSEHGGMEILQLGANKHAEVHLDGYEGDMISITQGGNGSHGVFHAGDLGNPSHGMSAIITSNDASYTDHLTTVDSSYGFMTVAQHGAGNLASLTQRQ